MSKLPVCEVCPGKNSDKEDIVIYYDQKGNESLKCTAKFGSVACSRWLYGWFCGEEEK